jgi:FkbM family methyltransferase
MRESKVNTRGKLYPKTKNYRQKVFFRKVFGKKFYKFFKTLKIVLLYKSGKSFEISEFLGKVIKKDFIIFDVGANLGQYAIRLEPLLKGEGKIISIEPVYEDYLYLQKLKKYFKLNNLTCLNYAVSNCEREGILYIPLIDNDIELDTRATVDKQNYYFDYPDYKTQNVSITTLSSLFNSQNLSRLDIIKSDTEGNDCNVIMGSIDLIKKYLPIILIEDSHEEDWLKEIYEIGYLPYYVIDGTHLIDAFKAEKNDTSIKFDLLVLIKNSKLKDYSIYLKPDGK